MGTFFLDTSAIVKRYILEQGHVFVLTLHGPEKLNNLYISQAAFVEVVSSFCRRGHEKSITSDERDRLINLFRQHIRDEYNVVSVNTATYTRAGNLCRVHRLRAYDAVQLACALALRVQTRANKLPDPIFVCADNNLLSIASAEGLDIDNPNNYPRTENTNPTWGP